MRRRRSLGRRARRRCARAETIALGLLQGPAELLPVSSSAHVGLLPWAPLGHAELTGAERKEVEVALHAGTAITLALADRQRPRWALLAAATAPPALAGLLLERPIEERLGTPATIAAGLLAGSVAMVLADRTPARRGAQEAGAADGAWLGAAQALALIPASRAAARHARRRGRAASSAPTRRRSRARSRCRCWRAPPR